MYRLAIVEDEATEARVLRQMLETYEAEFSQQFQITEFKNAVIFLTNYQPNYDIIFLDIQMPYMDGMEAARKLRSLDTETMLVFVTSMAQMAVEGYQVQAFDFLVKPVNYDSLVLKLKRMLAKLDARQEKKIMISTQGKKLCLPSRDVIYVEVRDHQLVYHTCGGDYPAYGTLSKTQEQLEGKNFALCNSCYLINLGYVEKVYKHTVTVRGEELPISHPRRKAFLDALNEYIGG